MSPKWPDVPTVVAAAAGMTRAGLLRVLFPRLLGLPVLSSRSLSTSPASLAGNLPQRLTYGAGATWARFQTTVRSEDGRKVSQHPGVPAIQLPATTDSTAREQHEVEVEREEEEGFEVEGPPHTDSDLEGGQGGKGGGKSLRLRILREGQHPLENRSIPRYAWLVLNGLRKAGYEAYLVGGSIRDLLLKRTPKDFDVLSTASPHQVKRLFAGKAMVVGRRFPICHVRLHGTIIEVSSFSTEARPSKGKGWDKKAEKQKEAKEGRGDASTPLHSRKYEWGERDTARWENARKRDFTVNGLLYDPFKKVVYDYVGGVRDLKQRKVRTITPAEECFSEDAARFLRAIRIAARLGLSLDGSISRLLEEAGPAVATVSKSRLMLEMQSLLAYGAAEASLRLLWRYRLLELLLPLQADYLRSLNFARRSKKSNFLFDLMGNLDRVVSTTKPCHGAVWTALLALQLAVAELEPNKVAVAAAALAVCDRQGLRAASEKARRIDSRVREEAEKEERRRRMAEREKQTLAMAAAKAGSSTSAEEEKEGTELSSRGSAGEGEERASGDGQEMAEAKPEKGRDGASVVRQSDASTSGVALERIEQEAQELGDHVMGRLRDLMDSHINGELVRETLGMDPGDLVVIPKASLYKAHVMLRGISPQSTEEDMGGGSSGSKKDRGKQGRDTRQQISFEEEENRNAVYLFSRIALNTIYPRTGKS